MGGSLRGDLASNIGLRQRGANAAQTEKACQCASLQFRLHALAPSACKALAAAAASIGAQAWAPGWWWLATDARSADNPHVMLLLYRRHSSQPPDTTNAHRRAGARGTVCS